MMEQKNLPIGEGAEHPQKFRFEITRDNERGRVTMRDGDQEWVIFKRGGELHFAWKPNIQISREKYEAMLRQAAAILDDMAKKREESDRESSLPIESQT